MQIAPINTTSYKYNSPAFRGNFRMIMDKSRKNVLYKTFTYTFRNDFNWFYFPQFISNKYKNVEKVTFVDHACSSGEETVSIVSKLMEDLGEEANKFFPILARDFDEINIASAKRGIIYMTTGEKDAVCRCLKYPENYFYFNNTRLESIQPRSEVLHNIDYKCSNILDDIEKLPDKNTILFCRNLWLWLKPEDRTLLMQKIADKFKDDSSIIAIGEADTSSTDILDLLCKNGFKETFLWNVFSRSGK